MNLSPFPHSPSIFSFYLHFLFISSFLSRFPCSPAPRAQGTTAVKPWIYGFAFTLGKWFLTDNSATVGRILMIFLADLHEILMKWWKKISPLARKRARTLKNGITRVTNFGQFWPIFGQKCFSFCDGKFFHVMENPWTFEPCFLDKNVLFGVYGQDMPIPPEKNN